MYLCCHNSALNTPVSVRVWIRLVFFITVIYARCVLTKDASIYFDILPTVHLGIFILVITQLDARNFCFTISLFHASTCAHHQEVKIALHSPWYCHTETSEWSKITKMQFAHIYRIVF